MASVTSELRMSLVQFTSLLVIYFAVVANVQVCDCAKSVHVSPLKQGISLKSRLLITPNIQGLPINLPKHDAGTDLRVRMETDGESENEEDVDDKLVIVTTARPSPLLINSHPILTSASLNKLGGPPAPSTSKPQVSGKKPLVPDRPLTATESSQTSSRPPLPLQFTIPSFPQADYTKEGEKLTKTQLSDFLPSKGGGFQYPTVIPAVPPGSDHVVQGFQTIKDAYFEVLEKMRDFKNTVSKRFEMLEREIQDVQSTLNKTISLPPPLPQPPSPYQDNGKIPEMHMKMLEMERRFNITRLVDHCVHYILANSLAEAGKIWTTLEMLTASNLDETNENLREIVHLAYTRNSSNISPIFPFLRRLNGVEKLPLYDFLINGMKTRDDFDGSEIFYIAQFLKERNAVRSAIYSKIPKAVQYAVSGRNVNIVFVDKRSGRHYVHVRDDQNRRDRLNFYIQASQSYTDTRAAVWNVDFEPSSETFRIRNSLYGDYMYVNEEGFLETLPASTTLHMGTEFNFVLKKNTVMIQSKNYKNHPLVVIRGGGKFPFYFSLHQENPHAPIAEFLIEPDTLL